MKNTPQSAKEIFQPFLFPCRDNKKPVLEKGQSWEHKNPEKKQVVRSTESPLCGFDCGQAGVIVADIDAYKKTFNFTT